MLATALPVALALLSVLPGCDDSGSEEPVDVELYLWVSAESDASVKCTVAQGCSNGDTNYAAEGELQVASGDLERKRSYVRFPVVTLPAGVEIVESHLEFFHGGTMEDGTTDNLCIPVARAGSAWQPSEVTWNDQPNGQNVAGEYAIDLRSAGWSPTEDVTPLLRGWIDGSIPNDGLVLALPESGGASVDKAFSSNNSFGRTQSELGRAPRLLVKLAFKSDVDPAGFVFPDLPASNDLPFDGEDVVMATGRTGETWPADWEVALPSTCP